jgi:hypothetical protein
MEWSVCIRGEKPTTNGLYGGTGRFSFSSEMFIRCFV